MTEESASHVQPSSDAAAAANYLDIKLHGVYNIPAAWTADCGAAPVFNDHVFRYEMDITVAGHTHTFTNGRLLQNVPTYADFVQAAKLPPVVPNYDDDDAADDVPAAAPAPPKLSGDGDDAERQTPPQTGRTTNSNGGDAEGRPPVLAGAPAAVLWVLGPEVDTEVKEDTGKKDSKPAPKKGAAAAAPAPPPEVVKPIPPNSAAPPLCVVRIPLSLEELSEFENQVENLLPVNFTFRRVIRAGAPADWEDTMEAKFQAKIALSVKPLTEPGSKAIDAQVPLEPVLGDGGKDDDKGGKNPKKAAPKKTKGSAPAILTDELDPSEPHPYVASKTYAHISVVALNPVTRLPQGRPRPDLQPSDMIPKRLMPPRRPVEATKRFSHEIEGLIARIVRDYRRHKQTQAPGSTVDDLRASFLQGLSASGRSRVYQDLLVPSVQGIVKETFIRKASPTPEEMDKVSNELYTYLLDHLHLTLNRTFAVPSAADAAAALDGDAVERWRRLAMEAEVMREYAVAARYHQERLVQCRNRNNETELPDVWCEYAEFSLRVRDALKAEQGYREALAVDMGHLPSLIGYGTLLLGRQRFREAEVYLQAAVDIDGNTITWGCLALYFDTLLLSLADSPHEETRRAVCRRESKYAMTQAVRVGDDACTPATVYEQLGKHLLHLHQEELANVCLSRAAKSPTVDCLLAKVFLQTNQPEEAVSILQEVVASNSQNAEARLLLGDVYAAMGPGKSGEAEQQYDAALRIDPQCGTGPSYVRLGNMYIALGKHKDALSAFLMGAKVWPCGLTWLGVGIAYYRMDDLARAEQALSESNILNSLNPKTWAYLALLCLRQRREDEGDQAFNQAIKQSLADPHLIAEVGAEQLRLGRHKIAEACFRRSLALNDDCNTRMYLARTLSSLARHGEARDEYAFVARTTTNDAQRQRAEEQMAAISVDQH